MGIKITGISTPFGGLSWEVTDSEKDGIKKLFYFLEGRRLLVNPSYLEVTEECAMSAIEIKNFITHLLGEYKFSTAPETVLRDMVNTCNSYLDNLNLDRRPHIIYKNGHGDWEDSNFSSIMKKFRAIFRRDIKELADHFNLVFNKCIPEEY